MTCNRGRLLQNVAIMLVIAFACAPSGTLWAQRGVGVRGGLSIDPDQLYFGVHAGLGRVMDKLWFRPNIEAGFGDNITTIALNGEFIYRVRSKELDWDFYLGAGPAINIYSFHRDFPARNDTKVEPGFNLLLGLVQHGGFFAELKVGAIDSPEVKLGFGYNFR
ncbi:hypothetical protein MYX75_13295 [Acidobacteria bacterium AH-259-A15]|nr:hypothetical protein [Acidobacteria bacterium AH-259-A15]